MFCRMYPNKKEDQAKAPWYVKSSLPLHALAVAVSASYVVIGDPIFHQVCFGAILAACVLKSPQFITQNLVGHKDEKIIRHKSQKMIIKAVLLMASAFGIWNIDNIACIHLRNTRNSLFGPLAVLSPLLQFHAWWHMLTCAAADFTVAWIIYVWCQGHVSKIKSKLTYKLWGCFPLLKMEPIKRRTSSRKVKSQ